MADKFVLVEHTNLLSDIIHSTFQETQRIKLTSFDVSERYLVFGASSGGVYIFGHSPCEFIKLIPGSHGPAILVAISKNESNLALATSSGSVVILEDCFTDATTFQQQVYTEHEGQTVTAMKWHGIDLYCGDNAGKVSVTTTKNFLSKAIFQTPVACLMHLESPIVQLDAFSKFLLVSTQTRSLLCDTEAEQYRQIGKRLRDGPFGACFLNVPDDTNDVRGSHVRGIFQSAPDSEQFSTAQVGGDVQIFCARPGIRLWQADFQANVTCTSQFRGFLDQKPPDIVHLDENLETRFKIMTFGDDATVPDDFNFRKIFQFLNKFILTFREDGFYVFDPVSKTLLMWCHHFTNIKDVKNIGSVIYVWHNELELSVLAVVTVEELILMTLIYKQYHVCGRVCAHFSDEVEKLIATSPKIHLISVLEAKLNDFDDSELIRKLSPILRRLKERAKGPSISRLKNGIVMMKNLSSLKDNNNDDSAAPEPAVPVKSRQGRNTLEISTIPIAGSKREKGVFDIFLEHYTLSKLNRNIETTELNKLLKLLNLNKLHDLLSEFVLEVVQSEEDEDLLSWCHDIYLRQLHKSASLDSLRVDPGMYAVEAFLDLNNTNNLACFCRFPIPKAHTQVPVYYSVGCRLMDKVGFYNKFTRIVPYMNKFILEKIDDLPEVKLRLPLIIQFSDLDTIKKLLKKATYDIWDDSLSLLVKLKQGICLYCDRTVDITGALDWKAFATLMVQSIDSTNAVKILQRYAKSIPNGELDEFFYQYCIFSVAANLRENDSSRLNEMLNEERLKKKFEKSVGGYLRKQYLRNLTDSRDQAGGSSVANCDYCQLPLKTPVIDDVNKLGCGHIYHKVCLWHKKNKCCICDPVL